MNLPNNGSSAIGYWLLMVALTTSLLGCDNGDTIIWLDNNLALPYLSRLLFTVVLTVSVTVLWPRPLLIKGSPHARMYTYKLNCTYVCTRIGWKNLLLAWEKLSATAEGKLSKQRSTVSTSTTSARYILGLFMIFLEPCRHSSPRPM